MESDTHVCVTFLAIAGSLVVAAWLWWRDRRWDREASASTDTAAERR